MAPTPDPTVPLLETTLTSKTIDLAINKLYLGRNIVVSDSTNGFQTTLPVTTTDLMHSGGFRVASGSTYDYFKSDNFNVNSLGAVNSKGTFTSTATGLNSLAGSLTVTSAVTAGSLSSVGALTVGSASVTGAVSSGSISSGAITSSATMTANNLKITSTNLQIDSTSATNSITLNGALKVNATATGASVFKLDSTTGEIKTYGNISATGTGSITAGGSLNAPALNIGTGFKVDSYGALVVKDSTDNTKTLYSFDKNGNFSTSGSLTAPGTATLATGKFVVDGASGNLTAQGTISSGNVAVSGSLKTTGVVNIGGTDESPAIQLSNNGTSYFKNSVQIGEVSTQKSILNADGTASFATGNFTVASTGDVVAKGTASFGDNAVALGYAEGAGPANAKVSLDSAGNVLAAGTLAVVGNSTFTGTLSVASNKLNVNASGDLATKGVLSVSDGKLTADVNGNVVAVGTLQVATNKFTVNAVGDVSTSGKLAVTGDSTLGGKLDVIGNSTFAGTLSATGAVTAGSTLRVTGATTLSSTLAVTGDLAVNTDKFKVTASSGDVGMLGNLNVTGNAIFAGNQIQLNSDGSLYVKNYLKTDFVVADYVKSTASDDLTTSIVPTVNSVADQALFNSSTNKYLTTQEYVDRAVFKQAARLNLITKDVDTNLATFNNFSKVLAAIEGSSAATIVSGLVDSVDDIKVSVSDLMGGGYNSIVISCVPSVWGDAAAPEPIPTPISDLYKEDGWFYSNLASNSKINWYLPAYSGMKMKDITNLFMNNFLLSTVKLPKITIYTVPKNNSTDAISGVYNAKIQYNFNVATPSSSIAQRSALYIIDAPKNVYSNKLSDIKSVNSITTQGGTLPVTTPITTSTLFSNSFDTSKVGSEDTILTFAIETTESNIKDCMFILQNFNISTQTGTTQMLFQNVSVVNDYLFKYFFRQHTDFSDASNNINVVDKNTYAGYVSNILANSLVTIPSSSIVSPESHVTDITVLTLGGKSVTYNNQTLTFTSNTATVPMIVALSNDNNKLTIKQGLNTIVNGVAGDFSGNVMLVVGNNTFDITVNDKANDHSTIIKFYAYVISSDARIDTIKINGDLVSVGSLKTVAASTTSVTLDVKTKSLLATVQVLGATGLVKGNNTITINVTAEDGTTTTSTVTVRVLSSDTSLSTFTMNGGMILDGSVRNLPAGTTSVDVVALPTDKSFGAVAVISGNTGLIEGDNEVIVKVTAENGAIRDYKFNVHVQNDIGGIASMKLNGTDVNIATSQFTMTSITTSVDVVVTPNSNKSTVVVAGASNLQVGSNTMTVKVTTEQGTLQTYTYTLYRQSGNANISSAYINSQLISFDSNNNASISLINREIVSSFPLIATAHDVNAILTHSLNSVDLGVLTSNTNKTITNLLPGDNTLTITDTAEDRNVFKTYTITIRNLSSNADLIALTADYSTYPQVNLISTPNNTIGDGLIASIDVTINATIAVSHATVSIDGVVGSGNTITVSAGSTRNVAILVTAGDGTTTKTYNVSFTMPALKSSDNSLSVFKYKTSETPYLSTSQDDVKIDLDKSNNNITINKTKQTVVYITALPNDSTTSSVKLTVPFADRVEVDTRVKNSMPLDTTLEDYYTFRYLGKHGSSKTITIEITAENGDKNTYSITVNVASLETVAPYLTSQSYMDYVNANNLSTTDYFVETAVTFGSNNNLHMVTLISNTASFDLYSQTESGALAYTSKNRDIKVLIFNGLTWKHSSYKSDVNKYDLPVGATKWLNPTYSLTGFYPIYNNDSSITFAILYHTMYYVNPQSGDINYNQLSQSGVYTIFIQKFNESVFYRFIATIPSLDFSPSTISNTSLSPYESSMYNYLIPINNFVYNNRTVPVYYFDYNAGVNYSVNKRKYMVYLNYVQSYRPIFMVILAYESNGTTLESIDNLTFTNVALVGNKIEFTTTTGDKYINTSTDPNPVASAGSYYNIKKVEISDANNDSLTSFTATYSGSVNTVTDGATITLASGVNNVLIAATSYYYGATVNVDGIIGTGYSSRTIDVPTGTSKDVFVTVTPANGVTKQYKVTFVAPSPSDTRLSTFTVNGDSVVNGSSVNLPAGTTSVTVVAIPYSETADVFITGNTGLQEGNNYLDVTVSDNGTTFVHTVTLIVASAPPPAPQPAITSFQIGNQTISSSNGVDYYWSLAFYADNDLKLYITTTNTSNLSITTTAPGSTIDDLGFSNNVQTYWLTQRFDNGNIGVYTITLSTNGVNKIYYLHVTRSD